MRGRPEGIPHRYTGQTPQQILDNMGELKERSLDYLEGREPGWGGATLHGPLGRGKTGSCVEIMRLFGLRGLASRFVTLQKMTRYIKTAWDLKDGSEEDREKMFTKPALLVVDEAGVGFDTLSERNVLYGVLTERYHSCFPTLVTTNCDLNTSDGRNELLSYIGLRAADRLRETVIDCGKWGGNIRG